MVEHTCERCGVSYTSKGRKSRFCKPCRDARQRERIDAAMRVKLQEAEKRVKSGRCTLNDVVALADRCGMSYGAYSLKLEGII